MLIDLGSTEDYAIALSWTIGPGGLLDPGRLHLTNARFRQAGINLALLASGHLARPADDFWSKRLAGAIGLRMSGIPAAVAIALIRQPFAGCGYVIGRLRCHSEVGVGG